MTAPVRRTQEQRRTATRLALLDAALETLVDRGVAGFTTPEVVRRAGVSQGTLFKHFPAKPDLWAATIEHLFAALRQDWEAQVAGVSEGDRTVEVAVDRLWDQMQDPRLAAAFELYTAARTDADLRASLAPVVQEHVARLHQLSLSVLPAPPTDPEVFAGMVDLVVLAMQGLVVEEMAAPDPAVRQRLLATLRLLAEGYGRSA